MPKALRDIDDNDRRPLDERLDVADIGRRKALMKDGKEYEITNLLDACGDEIEDYDDESEVAWLVIMLAEDRWLSVPVERATMN